MINQIKKLWGKPQAAETILPEIEKLTVGSPDWEMLMDSLERDPNKPFQTEWERTVTLKTQLIKRFGYDGVKLLYGRETQGELFALGEWPDDCPWASMNNLEVSEVIRSLFASLSTDLPRTIQSLVENCTLLMAERSGADWRLHYPVLGKLHSGADYFWHYIGGEPAPHAILNSSLMNFGWEIPPDLLALYAIHDGFGCADRAFIHPSARIAVMAEYMNPIVEDIGRPPKAYRFEDLLEVCPDGSGNAQCFYREGKMVSGTVDWDHETWELSGHQSFFTFVDLRFSELEEE